MGAVEPYRESRKVACRRRTKPSKVLGLQMLSDGPGVLQLFPCAEVSEHLTWLMIQAGSWSHGGPQGLNGLKQSKGSPSQSGSLKRRPDACALRARAPGTLFFKAFSTGDSQILGPQPLSAGAGPSAVRFRCLRQPHASWAPVSTSSGIP